MILLLLACGGPDDPPDLLSPLDGDWAGEAVLADTEERRAVSASFSMGDDGALTGELWMSDPDRDRGYEVIAAEQIEALGLALQLIELTGVRELFTELPPPEEGAPLVGPWRTRWFCAEGPDGSCGEDGTWTLERR